MAGVDNKTCARLEVQEELNNLNVKKTLFVKSVWEPTSFSLAISDGHQAWTFKGTEEFVKDKAEVWDKDVIWVMEKLEFYLRFGQPGVPYLFTNRDNRRKLSFDIRDKETNLSLTANFSLLNASEPENVTSDLLDFLLEGNARLTEDYLRKCRSFDQLKLENEALLEQNRRFANEKNQFEQDMYKKFVAVFNTKKLKLKELKRENANLIAQLKAKQDVEKNSTTSSSSDDDEEESDHEEASRLALESRVEIGDGLVSADAHDQETVTTSKVNLVNADPDATQPFLDELEVEAPVTEPPNEVGPSNAVAALLGDTPYTGLPRKRRRN